MATNAQKSAGRPKASPSELLLRRIGKHFESADQLLASHKESGDELRDSGQGKQPFNSYIKSLQDKLAMYESYLSLLAIYADEAGYVIDTDIVISDEDKERPWEKLKAHYRDPDGQKLTLKNELKERRKVFDGSRQAYNKDYPFIEWCSFWFESEVNAAQRLSSQAIMSFDLMGVNYLTLDQTLSTAEAKKGRNTFLNKKGKNMRNDFTHLHADIIRHKTRFRKAIAEVSLSEDDVSIDAIKKVEESKDKATAKKGRQIKKLFDKINKMESDLEQKLKDAPWEDQVGFDIALLKKERLPLVKLQNANQITPIQRVKLANLDKQIQALKETLEEKEKEKQAV